MKVSRCQEAFNDVFRAESSACPLLPPKSGNQQGSNIAPE
jgi:hypothetical protein